MSAISDKLYSFHCCISSNKVHVISWPHVYSVTFKSTLETYGVRSSNLTVIGYIFRDEHVFCSAYLLLSWWSGIQHDLDKKYLLQKFEVVSKFR